MAKKIFSFEEEFRLGIGPMDNEHMKLVDMLNKVYDLMGEGKKDEAKQFFSDALTKYVDKHFYHEEKFLEIIGFPGLDDHKKVHENFKKNFHSLKPQIESGDDRAFRNALSDAFTWLITHISGTDQKYARFYKEQEAE